MATVAVFLLAWFISAFLGLGVIYAIDLIAQKFEKMEERIDKLESNQE